MEAKESRFTPPIKKPIAGWRAFLGCLLIWLIGSTIAAELSLHAGGALGAAGASPASAPLFEVVRLWEYALVLLAAAAVAVIGRAKLRIDQYGRFAGRLLVFSADFLLSLAAIAGASDALGGAALVLLGTDPLRNYIVLTAVVAGAALVVAAVLNRIRVDRFLTNLYQISMM